MEDKTSVPIRKRVNNLRFHILLISIIGGFFLLVLALAAIFFRAPDKGAKYGNETQKITQNVAVKSDVPGWPDNPDFKHFEEAVLSMEFAKGNRPSIADIMPGQLFSHMKVGPGLNEVFISVMHAVPFKRLANSDIPAVQRQYRQQIVLSIAKQYNLFLGKSVQRPFEVSFYFLETLPKDAYRLVNPEVLSMDRVWLLITRRAEFHGLCPWVNGNSPVGRQA